MIGEPEGELAQGFGAEDPQQYALAGRDEIQHPVSDPEALRGSFELYRALDVAFAQSEERKTRRLTMPVLVIGGTASIGDQVADTMKLVADDVQSVVIPGAGHWLAEEAPDEFLAAMRDFLAPYRDG